METIIIIGIVVGGFLATQYLHYKHIARLELLLKAEDIQEVKLFEKKSEKEAVGAPKPENLMDAIDGKNPEQIKKMFPRGH